MFCCFTTSYITNIQRIDTYRASSAKQSEVNISLESDGLAAASDSTFLTEVDEAGLTSHDTTALHNYLRSFHISPQYLLELKKSIRLNFLSYMEVSISERQRRGREGGSEGRRERGKEGAREGGRLREEGQGEETGR